MEKLSGIIGESLEKVIWNNRGGFGKVIRNNRGGFGKKVIWNNWGGFGKQLSGIIGEDLGKVL